VQNEAMKYGYARVSTDDQSPALQLATLKNRMQNHFQRRRLIESHDETPCPSPLPEEA
jgi:DNA invertase Pin-like site-specific DNA recombinase